VKKEDRSYEPSAEKKEKKKSSMKNKKIKFNESDLLAEKSS
jgi:hypothetical protein